MIRTPKMQGVPQWHNPKYFSEVNAGHLHGNNGALGLKKKFKDEVLERLLTDSIPFNEQAIKNPRGALEHVKGWNAELICVTRTEERAGSQLNLYYM